MKIRHALAVLAALAVAGCTADDNAAPSPLDAYKAEFTAYPAHVPTNKTADAPLAGNGDIGLTFKSSTEGITCYIGKNDFWRAIESYPEGGIALPGALTLKGDILVSGTYRAEQLPGSAEIRASYQTADNRLDVTAWVGATDNKVVLELVAEQATTLEVAFLPTQDDPIVSRIEQGSDKGCSFMTRSFCDDPRLKWESHVALALNRTEGEICLKPGKKQTLVLTVYTNLDTPQWKEQALAEAAACKGKSMTALKRNHRQWWKAFWDLSHVNISDPWMEQHYYQSQYLFACSSREGKMPPGLWGPFISADNTAWAGDYHLNYNYQSPYWGCFSSNQLCLTDNYDQPILDYMDKGRAYAKELLGCRGLYYPVGIGPFGLSSAAWPDTDAKMKAMYGYDDHLLDGGNMFWGQKSNAAFCAINMMMRFYATWDKAYAERIYPFIVGCAEFWEDYLTVRGGCYESLNDCFNEEWPGRGTDTDVNPACSLGLIRMVMRGALDLSDFLCIDGDKQAMWNDILAHLSPYPTGLTDDGRVSLKRFDRRGLDGNPDDFRPIGVNRIHMHGMLVPPMVCGPLTDSLYAAVMLDDMEHWTRHGGQDWGASMGNGVETVYAGAARLGYDPAKILSFLKERIQMQSYPNGYIVAAGGGVETLAAVPFAINEMLMQSFEGVVRLFPCWTRTQDASFHHLRANGAFLVSASIQHGLIGDVELYSEQGRPCKMENPWPGHSLHVHHADGTTEDLQGTFVEFSTTPGETLRITAQ